MSIKIKRYLLQTFLLDFRTAFEFAGKTLAAASSRALSKYDFDPPEYLKDSILPCMSNSVCGGELVPGKGNGNCKFTVSLNVIAATLVPLGSIVNHSNIVFTLFLAFLNPVRPILEESSIMNSRSTLSSHPKYKN